MNRGIALIGLLLLAAPAWSFPSPDRMALLSGYVRADIDQGDYEMVPLVLHASWPLRGGLRLAGELLGGFIASPHSNGETAFHVLLEAHRALRGRLEGFALGGVGVDWFSLHPEEQGGQVNFVPQAGLGLRVPVRCGRWYLRLEYRYRHLSNAGMDSPNEGIEAHCVLLGLSWRR